MATTTLNTKIKLRYDTLENWQNVSVAGKGGNLILLKGEVAFCEVPATGAPGGKTVAENNPNPNYRPTVLFKVGAEDANGNLQAFKDLPWGSALAADVYAWAKAATKPTYTADEISIADAGNKITANTVEGALQELATAISLIEGGDGEVSLTSLQTAIELLNDDENTEGSVAYAVAQEANRIDDVIGNLTESTVVAEIGAVEDKIDTFADIQSTTGTANASGNATVVTNVSKDSNNKLSVEKTQITLGTAARADKSTVAIADGADDVGESTENNNLVTAAQVATYVKARTAALTGATHFKGALTVGQNETAADVLAAISNPVAGDIYLVGTAEYIYNDDADNSGTNAGWVLLGDEGVYATKAYVDGELADKVNKVTGYSLLADTEITRLAGIETGAEVNDVTDVTVGGTSVVDGSTKVAALGDLAGKDEVAESDLESNLASKINGKIDGVANGTLIASESSDIITLQNALYVDSNNKVANTGTAISLAKVAKTGLITDLDLGDGLILDGGNAEIPAQEP